MSLLVRIVVAAAAAAVLTGCVSQEQYRRALADNDNLREQRDALKDQQLGYDAENKRLAAELESLRGTTVPVDWLERERARVKELLEGMPGGQWPDGVTVRPFRGGIAIGVAAQLLFDSGRNEIKAGGKSTLDALSRTLISDGKRLRIEGHTDTDPIVNSPWETNLWLSAARSYAVATYLISSGVPPKLVSLAGFGEYQPVADGASAEAKAKNRRVEIVVLDDPADGTTGDSAGESSGNTGDRGN